jgi:hypothetical protein
MRDDVGSLDSPDLAKGRKVPRRPMVQLYGLVLTVQVDKGKTKGRSWEIGDESGCRGGEGGGEKRQRMMDIQRRPN